jgi:hypothetical protein
MPKRMKKPDAVPAATIPTLPILDPGAPPKILSPQDAAE